MLHFFFFCSTSATDNIFSMLAEEVKKDDGGSEVQYIDRHEGDGETYRNKCAHSLFHLSTLHCFLFYSGHFFFIHFKDSDVSAADPNDILKDMKVNHKHASSLDHKFPHTA